MTQLDSYSLEQSWAQSQAEFAQLVPFSPKPELALSVSKEKMILPLEHCHNRRELGTLAWVRLHYRPLYCFCRLASMMARPCSMDSTSQFTCPTCNQRIAHKDNHCDSRAASHISSPSLSCTSTRHHCMARSVGIASRANHNAWSSSKRAVLVAAAALATAPPSVRTLTIPCT